MVSRTRHDRHTANARHDLSRLIQIIVLTYRWHPEQANYGHRVLCPIMLLFFQKASPFLELILVDFSAREAFLQDVEGAVPSCLAWIVT